MNINDLENTAIEQLHLKLEPIETPKSKGDSIEERFQAFHRANPHVYNALVKMAKQLIRRGRATIGIGMLFEALRWNYIMQTDDPNGEYKLCNDYRSRYARLIMQQEDELSEAFKLRTLTAS